MALLSAKMHALSSRTHPRTIGVLCLHRLKTLQNSFCTAAQCEPEVCAEMEAQYGRKPYVPEREAYRHRFLMVVDGNSFSSRHAPVW